MLASVNIDHGRRRFPRRNGLDANLPPKWVNAFQQHGIFTDKPTEQNPLGKTDQIALWIQSSLFSFLAVLAVFGWASNPFLFL